MLLSQTKARSCNERLKGDKEAYKQCADGDGDGPGAKIKCLQDNDDNLRCSCKIKQD